MALQRRAHVFGLAQPRGDAGAQQDRAFGGRRGPDPRRRRNRESLRAAGGCRRGRRRRRARDIGGVFFQDRVVIGHGAGISADAGDDAAARRADDGGIEIEDAHGIGPFASWRPWAPKEPEPATPPRVSAGRMPFNSSRAAMAAADRSCRAWRFIQKSGVVPNTLARRSAVSGVTGWVSRTSRSMRVRSLQAHRLRQGAGREAEVRQILRAQMFARVGSRVLKSE